MGAKDWTEHFIAVRVRGVTGFAPRNRQFGVSFDVEGGGVLRVKMDKGQLAFLKRAIADAAASGEQDGQASPHSPRSSGSARREGSRMRPPTVGASQAPRIRSSSAASGEG